VRSDSGTETYAALRLFIDNWRWTGVPFLIRAGKAMPTTSTEAHIVFRRPPPILVGDRSERIPHRNHVTIRIGPDAGATIGVVVKDPLREAAAPVHLNVSFAEQVRRGPEPYERLLGAALAGDHTLFPGQESIEEMWRIVQPLLDDPAPLESYPKGSWGPRGAELLADRHGGWRPPPSPV